MIDDKFKLLFQAIQQALNVEGVPFELAAVKFDDGYLAVQFARCEPEAVIEQIKLVLGAHTDIDWEIKTPGFGDNAHSVKLLVKPGEPLAVGIPFSSPDEERGTEPIEMAQMLVRSEIAKALAPEEPPKFTTYVVWFSFILGGWKALVSTTIADGKYYEVTYNKEADEFYVDTYLKLVNTRYRNADKEEEPTHA